MRGIGKIDLINQLGSVRNGAPFSNEHSNQLNTHTLSTNRQ